MSMDNLMNLLDSLRETSIYVIEEKSHRLLYVNRRCRETGRGRAVQGQNAMRSGLSYVLIVLWKLWETAVPAIRCVMIRC